MKRNGSAVLALLIGAGLLWGQSDANKGQLFGTVLDPAQAVVAGAKVTVRNSQTGLSRDLVTNAEGQYRAVQLDPGVYEVKAQSEGFAPALVEGVPVTVGATRNVDVSLQVEGTTTTLEVGESLLGIDATPSTTISAQAIADLPINGRRFQDFATLTPTVQVEPQRGQLSFVGQRGIYTNVMLDGSDYNQPFFGGIRGGERSNSIITVPQSAIQEFQAVTSGYTAEYGRSTGGVLNVITQSGTNEIHGSAFYQVRHKELGAKDPVQNIASLETLQQFGGAVGGPLKRDKWFLFGAVEQQFSSTPRQVLFTQLFGQTPDPSAREAFDFFKSEELPFNQTNNATAFTAKSDYQMRGGHKLSLRYNFSNATAENAVSVGGGLSPFTNRSFSNDGVEKDRTHNGSLQYTHLLSPATINNFRFTGSYEIRPRLSNASSPQVDVRTIGTFGARNFLPTTQDDYRWQISDSLSVIRGSHTLKLGVDYNRVSAAQSFGFNQFGAFFVASSNVNEILDILTPGGAVTSRFDSATVTYDRQIGNLEASMGMHQVAAFVQDSWRAARDLTLDFGLRWEGQFNPAPETSNQTLVQQVQGLRFPNGQFLDPAKIRNSPAQFMPRFGFAWTPDFARHRRTVIRGHTGIFYASTPLLVVAGPVNNFRTPPGDVSVRLAPANGLTVYDQLLAVGVDLDKFSLDSLPVLDIATVQAASAFALGGAGADSFRGASLLAMAPDFLNPRSFQAGLGAETEVFTNFVASVQLNYVNTVHLLRNRDHNLPLPAVSATDASQRPNYRLRSGGIKPIQSLGSIWARESSARSMYRGVTVAAQYRASALQFGVNYTLADNFSDDDGERDATGVNYADTMDFTQDYAYSRIDIRHQLAGYAVYSAPWGFQLSGTLRARSGTPVNALTGSDTNEDLASNDRPFSAPGVALDRNSFRNRAVVDNNLRVMKNFNFDDVRRIQLSFEFFNLFNLDNVTYSGANGGLFGGTYGPGLLPNGTTAPIDPRFLRLRLADGSYDRNNAQSGTPFQMQVGLRFFF